MSTTGTRLRLYEATKIAEALQRTIPGESVIVGSIRRKRPMVGDIEIACEAAPSITVCDDPLFAPIVGAEYETVRGGKRGWKLWQIRHRERCFTVEFYRFDHWNRGSIILIRTGPAEFSKKYVMALNASGWGHEGGYIVGPCGRIGCPDEETAFRLAKMPWVAPEDRA